MNRSPRRALRTEIWVSTLVVLGMLVCAELAFRSVLPRLSANSRTLAAAPERAAALRDASARGEQTVLILGNSISGDGIDAQRLAEELAAADSPAHVAHQPADTTVARDWFFEFQNHFVDRGAAPDVLVLPVGDTAPLRRVNARTEDLLFSFVRWSDVPLLISSDEDADFEDASGIVFAKLSTLYGFRGRFQKRVLVAAVPRYEQLREAMRGAGATLSGEDEVSTDPAWAERLADAAANAGTEVVVVVMPTEPLAGGMPPEDAQLAEGVGWTVIAPGAGATWAPSDRPDGLHLIPAAAERFTDLLAADLASILAEAR